MTVHAFPPALMSISAAAHYLSVSPSKLRGLDLPRVENGGNRQYKKEDLDAYIASLPIKGQGENKCDEIFG